MKNRNTKGITLISIVITIIILVILAGIGINLVLGENGILIRASKAQREYEEEKERENRDLEKIYSSIKIATDSQITLTMEELSEYINQKVDERLKKSQPTGVKKDKYVGINSDDSSAYTNKTSMIGLNKTMDLNNSILEYLSYSDEKGYTILKSGWYFIELGIKENSGRVYLEFVVNGKTCGKVDPYCENLPNAGDYNSFSIYLNKGDTFYFSSGSPKASTWREVNGTCYPMF